MLDKAKLYMLGLFQADRKNMERMAEVVVGANSQQLHHFTSNSPWRARPVFDQVAREADAILGGQTDSCLLLDKSGFLKKGKHSVGVARQWLGRHGKVDNGQVGVYAALANGTHHTLIDVQLYLPKEWTDDPERCRKAGVPKEEIVFRSKAQLALEMVRRARANGVRYNWVGVDGGYGKEPWLLRALDADGEVFVADIHKNQLIYLTDPGLHVPEKKPGRGRGPARLHAQAKPVRADAWVAQQPAHAWRRVTLRDSTRGKLEVEILRQRVWLWDGEEEMAHCWHIIVRREPGSPDEIKYSLSNSPEESSPQRLAVMQGARFWVERSFQDGKSTCGMADYQVRSWNGWHHHMAMTLIAMYFMLTERLLQKEQMPLLSCGDIVDFFKWSLPIQPNSKQSIYDLIRKRHNKRQAAMKSAYKRHGKILE